MYLREGDLKQFTRLAERGFAEAQYNLGVMYHKGEGVMRDDEKAYVWFSRAALQGQENARKGLYLVKKKLNTRTN